VGSGYSILGTDQPPPSSAEIKNDGAVPPFPHTSPWRNVH
jgi:hypothetical protein